MFLSCLLLIEENLQAITLHSWNLSYTMLKCRMLVKELCVHQFQTPWHRLGYSPQLCCGGSRGEGEDTSTRGMWMVGLLHAVSALGTACILQETPVTEEAARALYCCWGLSHAHGEGVEKGTGSLAEKLIPFLRKRWSGTCRTTANPAMFLRGKVSFFPLNGELNCNSSILLSFFFSFLF